MIQVVTIVCRATLLLEKELSSIHGVVIREFGLYWEGKRFESRNSPLLRLKQVLHP